MDEGDRRGVDRLTIQQAARTLGISEGAVRKRVARRTLQHEKEEDGRVYVYLDTRDRRGVDDGQDVGVDPNNSALISQLRDEVVYLRDENRRKDEIIMQQAMTMRQLSAASTQEAPEAAKTVEEEPESVERHPAAGEAQAGAESQSSNGSTQLSGTLPSWQYLLGVAFSAAWVGVGNLIGMGFSRYLSSWPTLEVTFLIVFFLIASSGPSTFGFWVGYNNRDLRVWRRLVPLGAAVGTLAWVIFSAGATLVDSILKNDGEITRLINSFYTLVDDTWLPFVTGSYFFIFLALLGHGQRQRRMAAHPESQTSTEVSAASGPGVPSADAIVNVIGTVGAALIGAAALIWTN